MHEEVDELGARAGGRSQLRQPTRDHFDLFSSVEKVADALAATRILFTHNRIAE